MGNILYIVAVILVIGWAIGFLGYNSGGIIHILLVIAIIAVFLELSVEENLSKQHYTIRMVPRFFWENL